MFIIFDYPDKIFFNVYFCRAVFLAPSAGNALGFSIFVVCADEFMEKPVVISFFYCFMKIKPAGYLTEFRQSTGVPLAAAGAGFAVQINFVFYRKAIA